MAESKPIKVCLTNKGEDTETPWAHDLGPAPNGSAPGSRLVRLVNVPFMHAKPTWGDTIVVTPARDNTLTWDRAGTPWKQIASRIVEDGGRWAMIVDYAPHKGADVSEAFTALTRACEGQRVVCEGAWAPREGEPGRAYFAVPKEISAEKLMDILRAARLPVDLVQIHPEPKKRESTQSTSKVAAGTKKVKAGAVPVEKLAATPVSDEAPTTRATKASAKAAPAAAAPAAPAKAAAPSKAGAPAKAAAPKAGAQKAAPAKAAPGKAAPAKGKGAPAKAAPTAKGKATSAKGAPAAKGKPAAAKKPAKK